MTRESSAANSGIRMGVGLPNGGPWGDPTHLAELARVAETSGWDGVFLEDYVVWQGHEEVATFDPWIALAAIATATEKIRIGIGVVALPRRRPWNVAKAAVTLDHLSGGRMILGVGVGDVMTTDRSFSPFGDARPLRERAQMLDEGLAVLEGLWSGETFSFEGSFYRVEPVKLRPRPIQQPRIPIWVGGGYPLEGPVRRALRWDGSCLYIHKRPGQWQDWTAEDAAALRERAHRERGEGMPFDIVVGGRQRGQDEEAERKLIRSLGEAGATWWSEYIPPNAGSFDEVCTRISGGPLR